MEKLYQYLWKFRMFGQKISLTNGEAVEILNPGTLNNDAGPDFSSARIRIGTQEWIGNIELHVKATDWYRHNHDKDPAYDSVVLHVVAVNDTKVYRSDGREIPQCVVTYSAEFLNTYMYLTNHINDVKCQPRLGILSELQKCDWLESLAIERMHLKAGRILEMLRLTNGDWKRTTFVTLARALGFGLNSEPFEMLARSLPLNYAGRHSDNLMQLEALLFGQAGMLNPNAFLLDHYYQQLCGEYRFLAAKYGLHSMPQGVWKYARTRPGNFPHRRIAILASALMHCDTLLSDLIDNRRDTDALHKLFGWKTSTYWSNHPSFNYEVPRQPVSLGKSSRDLLLINYAAPVLYAYSVSRGDMEMAENAFNIWYNLPPERNSIIDRWVTAGITCGDAARSQALLQLRKEYCDRNRCLECRFGHLLLRNAASQI